MAAALIHNGADINNAKARWGQTVLMFACKSPDGTGGVQRPDLDAAELVLKSGADVNLTDRFGDTALFNAAQKGHVIIQRQRFLDARRGVSGRRLISCDCS